MKHVSSVSKLPDWAVRLPAVEAPTESVSVAEQDAQDGENVGVFAEAGVDTQADAHSAIGVDLSADDGWWSENTVGFEEVGAPCPRCGNGTEFWQDGLGRWHCEACTPPPNEETCCKWERIKRQVARTRRLAKLETSEQKLRRRLRRTR